MIHGDRQGRHYYTTAPEGASFVCIVVATLAVAMDYTSRHGPYTSQIPIHLYIYAVLPLMALTPPLARAATLGAYTIAENA